PVARPAREVRWPTAGSTTRSRPGIGPNTPPWARGSPVRWPATPPPRCDPHRTSGTSGPATTCQERLRHGCPRPVTPIAWLLLLDRRSPGSPRSLSTLRPTGSPPQLLRRRPRDGSELRTYRDPTNGSCSVRQMFVVTATHDG